MLAICRGGGIALRLLLLPALSLGAQDLVSGPLLPVVWSARLQLAALDAIHARLERPFDPLVLKKDRQTATIGNCAAYLAETSRGFRAGNDRDERRSQFVGADCHALELLESARPARRSALRGALPDPRFLPPTLSFLPSQEEWNRARAAQAKGLSWKAREPALKIASSGPDQILIETAEGYVRIDCYARGDFNGDGVDDLLLRVNSYPKQGTYASIRLFLLTRNAPLEILRVLREFD